MPRIIWAQDLNPLSTDGGAQATDKAMIREAFRRGHDVYVMTPETINSIDVRESDFVVLSNVQRFEPRKLAMMKNRYAFFHHDFFSACSWRLYFPWTEKCLSDRCPQSPIWKPVLERAKLHIFLSPLHYKVHSEVFKEAVEPHVLVPSAIDPDEFIDHGRDRSGYCAVNSLLSFKGRANVLTYALEHPDDKFTFAGDNEKPDEPLPANCTFVGPIPNEKLCEFYNKFEWFIHLPQGPMPFDRVCVESLLSGCKLKLNSLVGAASWPWLAKGRKEVAEQVRNAPATFWDQVGKYL